MSMKCSFSYRNAMDASTFYGNRSRNDSSSGDELLLANESSDEDFVLETESIDDSRLVASMKILKKKMVQIFLKITLKQVPQALLL